VCVLVNTRRLNLLSVGVSLGMHTGTENIPYAVGFGEAARIAKVELNEYILSTLVLKLQFLQSLEKLLGSENVRASLCSFSLTASNFLSFLYRWKGCASTDHHGTMTKNS
jgi:cysteine sulfinate desulfinase/cysteine desulfurase-like protein